MADPAPPANDSGIKNQGPMPLLYQNPQPLNFDTFGKSGLKRGATFKFAANVNAVPISVSEFQHAQKTYPIVFSGSPPLPIVALGFLQNENLFVSPDGKWAEDTYVPSYVRRYPFILGEVTGDERMYLCADAGADIITDQSPDMPFFTDGKSTEVVNQALQMCKTFQDDFNMTRTLSAELQLHNLLKPAELRYNMPDGTQRSAGTFVTIDSAILDALPDHVFLDFRKRGILPIIYMQQASQANWGRLSGRKERMLAAKTS